MRRAILLVLLWAGCGGAPPAPSDPDSGVPPFDGGQADASGPEVDAGAPDAGQRDAGRPDAGELDAGAMDAGSFDAGEVDAGPVDAGGLDAGEPDAGPGDAGVDAGAPDAGLGPDFVIEGFGAATKGGWQPGYDEYLVTSLLDSGPGTLREGLTNPPGPRIIRFALDGTIPLTSALLVPSNLTIDGRGHSITLTGKGLILLGSDDVIITNLAIVDVAPDSEDGLRIGDPTFGASERVVVDHVTFRATGNNGASTHVDEAMSIIFGSKDITLAWLRFENWEKVLLVGNGDASQAIDSAITVSWHHSYFKGTGRRHPQARFGIVDMWNDFFDDWHMYGLWFLSPYPESFGAQSQEGARVRVEQSLFRRLNGHLYDPGTTANEATRCELNGKLDGVGLVTTSDSTAPLVFNAGCTGSTGWTRPYPITLDVADATLRSRLETAAGNTL